MMVSSKVVLTALSAAALGAVFTTTLVTGPATGGARSPLRGPATGPAPVPPAAFAPGLTVEVAHCIRYGAILVTPAGMTVYRPVGGGVSDPRYHPLLATSHQPLRLPIFVGGRLNTVPGRDGGRQVTYDGRPLYVYSGDHEQGDTNGAGPAWKVIPLRS
jgi:Secreted repeat of unknown function